MIADTAQPQSANSSPQSLGVCDVVIVGGGIAGLTLACGLQTSGLKISIIEAQSRPQAAARQRAYALSLLSSQIFQGLGLWDQISPGISHFQRVELSDGTYPQRVSFTPQDLKTAAVYYGAEHGVLMAVLQQAVAAAPNISCWYETQVADVTYGASHAMVTLANQAGQHQLRSQLVVAADGMRSQLRQQAGIKTDGWAYWQSCITAIVAPEHSHQDTAYERFWPSGPFAILPLPGNRCQIVWTAPHAEASALAALPPDDFMAELMQRYGDQMGRLTLLSQPRTFPVQLMQSRRYSQPRLALIGDAAHGCHPVGGQGLNMGIRDAAALAQVLETAHQQQQDLGAVPVLKRYDRWRRRENWVVLAFTDTLNRSFSNRWWPLVTLRRLGLRLMIRVPPLRRFMLRLMTGLLGRRPQLATVSNPEASLKAPAADDPSSGEWRATG
jgi:2-octaprenyl-6-methoxyphenol hydroxylase